MQRIGRYEVLDHLASGGMGQVYLARMTGVGGFERQVVVKALEVNEFEDDSMVTMFLDEARLLGALHHHFIAPVYEVGCDVDGRYFLVMDYVDGETVEAVWRASQECGTPIPLAFALTVVSSIASALDYAHALRTANDEPLGIVHRDVSLSNIMIGHDGAVKLIDFGIAKAANRATKTQVGTLKGKIGYLAPEQVLHKDVDHRADIFALGIVLYELTTMTRAFRDSSDLNTLERITAGQIAPPSRVVDAYPLELDHIVMRALAVDPDRRFQDAGSMGRALETLGHRLGLQLGHAAIAGRMQALFEHGRRRFPRGSSELTPLTPPVVRVAQPAAPHEVEDVPTMPMDMPLELEPRTEPRTPAIEAARDERPERPARHDTEVAPVIVRFTPPPAPVAQAPRTVAPSPAGASPILRPHWPVMATSTAELVRPILPDDDAQRFALRTWLIACALIAALVAMIIALG